MINYDEITTIATTLSDNDGKDSHFAIVATRWYEPIVDQLVSAAVETLLDHGVDRRHISIIYCPGAFEIPLTAKKLASENSFNAIIALGVVVRGETPHFDYIAGECAGALAKLALQWDTPMGFGVLTVDTIEQAKARAGGDKGNKGKEAALAALEMVGLLDAL